jgi:hypothetical protein
MPIYILLASISLYAICPLYARIPLIPYIPLMHLYIYFITRIFVYSSNNISIPLIYILIRAPPILAPLFAPYLYREVTLRHWRVLTLL